MKIKIPSSILYIAIPVVVVAVVAGLVYVSKSNSKVPTLVVRPSEFLQQVSVSGKVVAAQSVDLGFTQSGRVSQTYRRVGDMVSAGALIAEIENGDLRASLLQKQATLEFQKAKLTSLQEGVRPEQIAITESIVKSDQATLEQANQAVINALRDAYTKADDAIHNKLDQFVSNPRSNNPTLNFQTTASQLAGTISTERLKIEAVLNDWQSKITSFSATTNISSAAIDGQNNLTAVSMLLANVSTALSRGISTQTVSQTTLNTYMSDIATARTNIDTAITTLNSAVTAQRAAMTDLETAKKNLALEQAGSTANDIVAQVAQVKAAEADVVNAESQLIKTIIRAPFTGTITKMDTKIGEIVSPNTPQISMNSNDAFQIESFVPEINIALIRIDNPAVVTLDAYGAQQPFEAKVVSIDPAETLQNGVSTYKTILEFTKQDPRIKSGMTANVVITTQKKSDVLSVPQGIVSMRGDKKYLTVVVGGKNIEREVTTGMVSSSGLIEILSGLKEGDEVVLSVVK